MLIYFKIITCNQIVLFETPFKLFMSSPIFSFMMCSNSHNSILLLQGGISRGEISILPRSLTLVTHEPSIVSTAPGPHIRGKTLRANSVGDKEVDLLLPGTGR